MNDSESSSPLSSQTSENQEWPAPEIPSRPPRTRPLRRFFLRHLPLSIISAALLLAVAVVGLYFIASSAAFEDLVRRELIAQLEKATGGRVEIAAFHWHLLDLEADADGVVIHGLEASGEMPLAQVEELRLRLSLLGLWSPRILLRSLALSRPRLHLIVYPGGATNLPQPRKPRKPGKPVIEELFDAKAGQVTVQQGMLHYENRAAAFDFQNRYLPLDFDASDVSLRMSYHPAASAPECYRIEAGATDLTLRRGAGAKAGSKSASQPVRGFFQATLDLTRSAATLRSLRVTARGRDKKGRPRDRTLVLSGVIENFAQPRWQATAAGELDMRLLDPVTGYPFAPEGIAHLELDGAGQAGEFRVDGSVHIEDGSYIGTGVVATGVNLDARVHADPQQLLISSIVARLHQGGQIEGDVDLKRWLPVLSDAPAIQPAGASRGQPHAVSNDSALSVPPPLPSDEITIPVNGTVKAKFNQIAVDTILEMVSPQPFQHLGLDARINGSALAAWTGGDYRAVVADAQLNLTAPEQIAEAEVPASGLIDATYTQRNGTVDLRKLEVRTPASLIEAHGRLGAYPLSSPSALDVDFHSGSLAEFDTLLRDLGVVRNGKSGAAALPIALSGQFDFHGAWTGSVIDPRLAGTANATRLAFELPAVSSAADAPPQFLSWDSVEATGSYSSAHISIDHGELRKGQSIIALNGSLDALPAKEPVFDANSTLHLRLQAERLALEQLLPLTSQYWPSTRNFSGSLNAQFQADGALRTLAGSGWIELVEGSVYGEPLHRIRLQGRIANQTLQLSSALLSAEAGKIAATGSYDFASNRFQIDAHGANIDVARIETLRQQGLEATGSLDFTLTGAGTLNDPRLEAHATLARLALNGEALGSLKFSAHTAHRTVTYDLTTRLEAAELVLHGQTAFDGDYATQARLDFSRFDIGALLKLAHIQKLSGESALVGTITLSGPLARPEQLRGEARIQELAITIADVHLLSEGGLHATLANSRITLDPLHITGEQTDLRVGGTLALNGSRQLDLASSGAINLKIAETIDPDLTASGTSTFQVEAHGPLSNPGLRGRIDFQDGSLSLEDLPNGLSQLRGTLEFNQNRLEVKSLTAMTGGGLLSLSGYLAYQHGLYADLAATGKGIRIRYPEGISSLADAQLRLQGTQNNLLLSGEVLITRFAVNPDFDLTTLAATANSVAAIAPPEAPSNHVRLDVHLLSSPQLSFQNAYAKLAGNVDLHLRGTLASPSLLGRVSITEGNATIAGTRYELQRGDIFFTNPVRIQPSIDLSATARVEDYDITLGLHGTPEKMAVIYRSDPPLPEADVVALLALGRTQDQQRLYTQQQEQALANPTTDALLGGALNATVSSRIQKLFGAGSVKVDPNYLGTLGNSTSRVTVVEQVGRNLTLTFATDVDTTSQQLLQAEVAINRHVSLVVARDESGVFSVVLKATRRYR